MSPLTLTLQNNPQNYRAGNIASAVREWEKLTKDPWILGMVQGVTFPLEAYPVQTRLPFPFRLGQEETQALGVELIKLENKGIIERTA